MSKISPNFLKPWEHFISDRGPLGMRAILLAFFLAAIGLLFFQFMPMVVYMFIALVILIVGVIRNDLLLYAVSFLSFLHAWQLDFSKYAFTESIPYISKLNAPLVEFTATMLLISFFIAVALKFVDIDWTRIKKISPVLWAYFLFLLVALLAVFFADRVSWGESFSYWLRPILFSGLVYILVPIFIIKEKNILMNVLHVWFGTGLLVAFYGLASLVFDPSAGEWMRVHPFALWGGFTPLDYNHNLLAEVLVMAIPIGIYLWYAKKKSWLGMATLFMALMALGTLSRAAWVSIISMVAVFVFIYRRTIVEKIKNNKTSAGIVLALLLLPAVFYMTSFLSSSVVKSSNVARAEMSRITFFYAGLRPMFGYGPGAFIPLLGETEIFRLEFGDPLDSHGVLQKMLIEEGVVGLVAFVFFVIMVFVQIWRTAKRVGAEDRTLLWALFIMILGNLVFQLFNTSYYKSFWWLAIGVGLAAVTLYPSAYEKK